MKITLLTHADESFKAVSNITIPVFQEYCDRYGYNFVCQKEHFDSGRHIVWEKISLILDQFENHRDSFDWLMYCDADALIMNHTIPLENFIDNNIDFIGTDDCHGYNSGVFMLKNSDWSLGFMRTAWNIDPQHHILRGRYNQTQAEQLAMVYAMELSAEPEKHIKIVPQNTFNSFPYGHWNMTYPEGNFKQGDFILHLPGMNTNERINYLNRFKELIIR